MSLSLSRRLVKFAPIISGVMVLLGFLRAALAAEPSSELPLIFSDDFEHGSEHWKPLGGNWKIVDRDGGGHAFRVSGPSRYKPPVTSPLNIALLKDHTIGDLELTADVRSTARDYPHRDMCLIFGYQDPSHFYYVHLGKKSDPHAHQVFIVNGQPRTKITEQGTAGTPWDDRWHKVRVTRQVADGAIHVYFDDLDKPIMTAHDKTFGPGQIGLGTFDDEGNWDHVQLHGRAAEKK